MPAAYGRWTLAIVADVDVLEPHAAPLPFVHATCRSILFAPACFRATVPVHCMAVPELVPGVSPPSVDPATTGFTVTPVLLVDP